MKKYLDYPYLFLVLACIFGFRFVYTNPPWQANDEDRHFYNAYPLSDGIIGPQIKDGKIGQNLPLVITSVVNGFQGIQFSDSTKISRETYENIQYLPIKEEEKGFYQNASSTLMVFPYIP